MEDLPLLGDGPDGPFPCFIDFQVTDQERFQVLCHAFEILKQEKLHLLAATFEEENAEEENAETENTQEQTLQRLVDTLFDVFDEQALSHFWWPSRQERDAYWKQWWATPVSQRFTDPTLKTLWDFESMIDSFLSGEYELVSCSLWTPDTGVLEFSPFAFPYGGTGCMKALIEAFDFRVIGEDDGTGYVKYL
ncbi:MAG: hypothetical protein ACJ8BW_25570 [Ktedonobacteraceae bacterium]